jgi:hypothetical protein
LAIRPIFIPKNGTGPLVETVPVEIKWHGGFSASQKQKNIVALHEKARELGYAPILEISTKSMDEVGRRLSAFNLKIRVGKEMKTLESVYQSSKVFTISKQHEHLMDFSPGDAKRAIRELGQGEIYEFRFMGEVYPTEPKNAFYDWLYIKAITPHEEWIKQNMHFNAYSDIEFTPAKSINCQARAVAEFHALSMRGVAKESAENFDYFQNMLFMSQRQSPI